MPEPNEAGKRRRLLVLLAVLALLAAAGHHYNLAERFDPQVLRGYIQSMGALGIALYLALFCIGLLFSVPGIIFMIAAGLVWGTVQGSVIALLGANLAILFSFTLVRKLQGEGFEADSVRNAFMSKMLEGLERRPLRTIVVLRFLISTAPALNYGFALSSITARQHFIGTVLGTLVPVVAIVVFADWLSRMLFA